ncbi:hypothetical protein AOQ84DRAFT_124095 [Glonium stellatum]|uniref:Uncharacterized protein n=1 Tax=Glonium stellatum TaxID=574774 RepID=A0A8E2JZU7_9PEZI|nr:hypothetical protein AOQ84DRAFT_124095 [Glonium stellatum]
MARKSARQSVASAPRSSSKRPAPVKTTPTRQSKRTKATSAKSVYFEHDSDDEENKPASLSKGKDDTEKESGYEEEATSSNAPSPAESNSEVISSEEDIKPLKKGKRGISKKETVVTVRGKAKEKELWKSGAKLPPGTQVIIKKPKAREAGATPYADDTIHPNTMLFLKDLAANNDREWLKMHDPDYRAALKDFTSFVECLTQRMVEVDETIPELPVKDIIFRIYRDIRFTTDPTPYKTYFSAAWSRTGRKGPYAAYYLQIAPGKSFVGKFDFFITPATLAQWHMSQCLHAKSLGALCIRRNTTLSDDTVARLMLRKSALSTRILSGPVSND